MLCLACGDCCKRMSPIMPETDELNKECCRNLVMLGDIAHCTDYKCRPKECELHDFPASICPIGLDVLNLVESEDIQQRLYNIYLVRRQND